MKVFVKTAKERYVLEVEASSPISALKKQIISKIGRSISEKELLVCKGGRPLKDAALISESNINESDTLLALFHLTKPIETPDIEMDEPSSNAAQLPNPDLQSIVNNIVGNFMSQAQAQTPTRPTQPAAASPGTAATASSLLMPGRLLPRLESDGLPALPPVDVYPEATDALQFLLDAGFPRPRSKKALWLNGFNAEMAMNWLIENMDNESVDLPFSNDELDSLEESVRDVFTAMGLTPQMIVNTPAASPSPAAAAQSLEQRVNGAIQDGVCTFCVTGRTYADQNWYMCYTCGFVDGEGVCESCKNLCHANHNVSEALQCNFFCDCGASGPSRCKSLKK
eukprot:TRINITY_DN387_c0_g1_i1.p1 TRINITY_DN387_c0_g1~~TRINITY_DN387_c0_g1_i1.p1  ORF type:complete len:339 (+),score=43.02 TRINITY_DN387_c0_g1_i1:99-1115(+)